MGDVIHLENQLKQFYKVELTVESSTLQPSLSSSYQRYSILFPSPSTAAADDPSSRSILTRTNLFNPSKYLNESNFYLKYSLFSKANIPLYITSYSSSNNQNDHHQVSMIFVFHDLPFIETIISYNYHNLLHLKAAIIELAKFHSSYFFSDTQTLPSDIPSSSTHYSSCNYQLIYPLFLKKWENIMKEYLEEDTGRNILQEIYEHCSQHLENWTILLEMGPISLLHGNYQYNNLILQKDRETIDYFITVCNFQSIYLGKWTLSDHSCDDFLGGDVGRANDLNCLLITSLDENIRNANEYSLISIYLQSLQEHLMKQDPPPSPMLLSSIPSEGEFSFYYRMATQGLVYYSLENYETLDENSLRRIFQAIVDHDLHRLLAVGRS